MKTEDGEKERHERRWRLWWGGEMCVCVCMRCEIHICHAGCEQLMPKFHKEAHTFSYAYQLEPPVSCYIMHGSLWEIKAISNLSIILNVSLLFIYFDLLVTHSSNEYVCYNTTYTSQRSTCACIFAYNKHSNIVTSTHTQHIHQSLLHMHGANVFRLQISFNAQSLTYLYISVSVHKSEIIFSVFSFWHWNYAIIVVKACLFLIKGLAFIDDLKHLTNK